MDKIIGLACASAAIVAQFSAAFAAGLDSYDVETSGYDVTITDDTITAEYGSQHDPDWEEFNEETEWCGLSRLSTVSVRVSGGDSGYVFSFDAIIDKSAFSAVDRCCDESVFYPSVYCTVDFYVDDEEMFWFDSWYGRKGKTSDKFKTYLSPGEHTLTWELTTSGDYWTSYDADDPDLVSALEDYFNWSIEISDISIEPVEQKETLIDWVKLLLDYNIWKDGNLEYLRDSVYGARIAANGKDYEARILRAATKIGMLVENDELRAALSDCGYEVEYYPFRLTGDFVDLESAPLANDVIDKVGPEVIAAIDSALEDITAIPENWNGSIKLDPVKYEWLNEPVYVDMAEITILRAALEGVKAHVLLAEGYDFEMDYAEVRDAWNSGEFASEVLDAAPKAGSVRDIAKFDAAKEMYRSSLKHLQRADQIIVWRTNPETHFFEYDMVDADRISRARGFLAQMISSLDHPETIDLPYLADQIGCDGEDILPGGMFRQIYLGALFTGKITRDLVPEVALKPKAHLVMESIPDVTLGGLIPDFSYDEFVKLFPANQYWSLIGYSKYLPAVALMQHQELEVGATAAEDGVLSYIVDMRGAEAETYFDWDEWETVERYPTVQCVVDGEVIDEVSEIYETVERSVTIPQGSEYKLVFRAAKSMKYHLTPFEIVSAPPSVDSDDEDGDSDTNASTYDEGIVVYSSLPDGFEFSGSTSLILTTEGNRRIYYTMNGSVPTTASLEFTTAISVAATTTVKFYAVDVETGSRGPVGSVTLNLVLPDSSLVENATGTIVQDGVKWTYQKSDSGVRLVAGGNAASASAFAGCVTIPSVLNWCQVSAIGAGLFEGGSKITAVEIPATVTEIEDSAFRGCTRLASVTLPEGLAAIGDSAFERCTSLTNIVIPASVTNIGYFAFRDCLRLRSVTILGDAPSRDLGAYMGTPWYQVNYGKTGVVSVSVNAVVEGDEIDVPEGWLDEIATRYDKPAGYASYQDAFKAKFGDDLKKALLKETGKLDSAGVMMYVWQDYVAGTNPLDEEDKFTATITMEDGVAVVRWSPTLTAAQAQLRKYVVKGATALDSEWKDVSGMSDQERKDNGYQFFRVSVEMAK